MREHRPAGADVALLIDFPRLVGASRAASTAMRCSDSPVEHGRVAAANAYADWTADDMSRYRAMLGGLGVEAVQVPGRSDPEREVCVRMAIDAVDLMWRRRWRVRDRGCGRRAVPRARRARGIDQGQSHSVSPSGRRPKDLFRISLPRLSARSS